MVGGRIPNPSGFRTAYQVLEECSDLTGEDGQVEEAGGELMVVLGEVVVAKALQGLTVLFLILHMGCTGRHRRGTWGDPMATA